MTDVVFRKTFVQSHRVHLSIQVAKGYWERCLPSRDKEYLVRLWGDAYYLHLPFAINVCEAFKFRHRLLFWIEAEEAVQMLDFIES